MDVQRVQPLHRLLGTTHHSALASTPVRALNAHVVVREIPQRRRDHQSGYQAVEHSLQDGLSTMERKRQANIKQLAHRGRTAVEYAMQMTYAISADENSSRSRRNR